MSLPSTNTLTRYNTVGVREDLIDAIYRVTPSDTPLLSAAGRTTATNTYHEWQRDRLDSASTTNARLEGDDASFIAVNQPTRLGNRTQISSKDIVITGTVEAVNKAGRDREAAKEKSKKAIELKRDIESILIGTNQASTDGASGSSARNVGSLRTWFGTATASYNVSVGSGAGGGGFSSSNTVAATDGTQRSFTQTLLEDVVALAWDRAGSVEGCLIMAGAKQKGVLTGFDGVSSSQFLNVADRKIINTADVYVSQFGEMRIVPNRYIRKTTGVDREVYIVNPEYIKVAYLRPFFMRELAATGDADKWQMLAEYTLEVCTEDAHGLVADLS